MSGLFIGTKDIIAYLEIPDAPLPHPCSSGGVHGECHCVFADANEAARLPLGEVGLLRCRFDGRLVNNAITLTECRVIKE